MVEVVCLDTPDFIHTVEIVWSHKPFVCRSLNGWNLKGKTE